MKGPHLLAGVLLASLLPLHAEVDWNRVRSPRALEGKTPPSTIAELRKLFADPPREFRTAPLWVWNDELQWPRLQEQMDQFRKLGIGGVFVHPRPGLMTEYLGQAWWDLFAKTVDYGRRIGLEVHIYDENSYPSGFAGGHVPARDPDTAGEVLDYEWRKSLQGVPWTTADTVAVFAVRRRADGGAGAYERLAAGEALPGGHEVLICRMEKVAPRAFTAGYPYVDLTDPRTTALFLETTYEEYRKRHGVDFGKLIRWAFSDEPELPKKGGWSGSGLPMSFRILSEFRRRNGYNLEDHLPSLYWDAGEFRKVRFDYWQLMHDLLLEAFFWPMFEWCDRNNLQWTGHWWEHLWPYPWSTPSDMSYYAFQHTPGIDMLIFSAFDLFERGVSPHMLFTIKQVASAARQLGRPRVLSETYGGGGWRATLEDFKRMGDWEIVHGVNLVNQHLAHATVRGARKRDWPQSFSDAAAWWPYYSGHADHTARLSLAMSAGEPAADVLVLNPTTSAFLLARRSEPQDGNPDLESLKGDVEGLVQFLADHQVSFDLGDEYLLEWLGETRGGELKVGRAAYRWVVLPSSTMNLRAPTVKLLEQHHAGGGGILLLGDPPRFVDGRPGKDIGAGWTRVASHESLLEELNRRGRRAPRIAFDHPLPPGVGFAERALRDGNRLLLLNNAGTATVEAVATVSGGAVEEWNTLTGEIRPYPAETREGALVRFRWKLPPAGSLLLNVSDQGAPEPARPATESVTELRAEGWKITPESPNVLALDFCDVNVNGREIRNALAMQAAKEIYRAHGFDANPWDGATQFRQVIFDRNRFGPDSGFTAAFRFEVADAAALEGLELAVETPELYQVRVNGRPVSFETASTWLDPRIRRTSITGQSRAGENVIEITGRPFDVRMELEAIYLLGRFRLRPSPRGFALAAEAALGFGPWSRQGRPFDGGFTRYDATVQAAGKGTLRVSLGRWAGSVAEVLIDGARAGVLGWAPWRAEAPVTSGRHEVTVRVAGTPRNVFGPFHDPRPEPRVLWPGHWNLFATIGQPRGEKYDVAPYGLFEPPRLELRR